MKPHTIACQMFNSYLFLHSQAESKNRRFTKSLAGHNTWLVNNMASGQITDGKVILLKSNSPKGCKVQKDRNTIQQKNKKLSTRKLYRFQEHQIYESACSFIAENIL